MRKVVVLIVTFILLLSCNKSENETPEVVTKPQRIVEQFGFKFNDFNVYHDTIQKGDTFGSIIDKQNIGDKQVYDIIDKVKDSFDVRKVRIGKPFTLLRSKDVYKKLQAFIYQPDRGTYYVIDFRDSISVYKKQDQF